MNKKFRVLLLVESSRASGRGLLKGIARFARHRGDWTFYWEASGLNEKRGNNWPSDIDGMIGRDLAGPSSNRKLLNVPRVVVGHRDREASDLVNVVTDSATMAQMAAEHLLLCGFKHFAFCGLLRTSLEQTPWSAERQIFFAESIVKAGFAAPKKFVLPAQPLPQKEVRRKLLEWLMKLPRPVGIMACNDDCGAQVIEACKAGGLVVPDEVGIVGVDNDELICGLSDPPMSSVAQNYELAGYEAAKALDQMMRRKSVKLPDILVQATHLVARQSSNAVQVDDESVARALRFIRDHARQPFSVNDVAKAVGISRRALERRFREKFRRSLLQEIRRVRTDEIARLLLETNLSVAAIAETLEFGSPQHIARYFYSHKKTSPLAFRRRHGKS